MFLLALVPTGTRRPSSSVFVVALEVSQGLGYTSHWPKNDETDSGSLASTTAFTLSAAAPTHRLDRTSPTYVAWLMENWHFSKLRVRPHSRTRIITSQTLVMLVTCCTMHYNIMWDIVHPFNTLQCLLDDLLVFLWSWWYLEHQFFTDISTDLCVGWMS